MKKTKMIIVAAAAVLSQMIQIQSASAQQFYPASVDVKSVSTNQAGNLTYQEFGASEIISNTASELGLTNLTGLSLVYDRVADAIEVVSGTNDTLVGTPLAFSGGVTLSNTNGTEIQRIAGVFWGTNQTANGTLVADESNFPATTNRPAEFKLQGQFQFLVAADGTNAPAIYVGNITAETPQISNGNSTNETHTSSKSPSKSKH
jgi:hypothetical protein